MVLKRKFARLKSVKDGLYSVFIGSLLITMVMSETTFDYLNVTEMTTEISDIPYAVTTSVSSSSVLTRLTSLRVSSSTAASIESTVNPTIESTRNPTIESTRNPTIESTRNPSMPSTSKLPSTLIPSSASAIFSTIPNSVITSSAADQRTVSPSGRPTTIGQASTNRTEPNIQSTDVLTSNIVTTPKSLITKMNTQQTSLLNVRTTSNSRVTTLIRQTTSTKSGSSISLKATSVSGEPVTSSTVSPASTLHKRTTSSTSYAPSDSVTTLHRTSPTKAATTRKMTTAKNIFYTTNVSTKPPKKATPSSLPSKTTTDTETTNVKGTTGGSNEREPLLTIPQWFAVFLGTFLTLFLIFLTNIWYKAKMTPDTSSKPSIELVKSVKKNDRPKSWQESNVPLDFMSLHVELPKETKVEMKCAENLGFEGDQPDNPGTSSNNPPLEVVTLTKL